MREEDKNILLGAIDAKLEMMPRSLADELKTYIFIDVANITNACRKSSGLYLDFEKLILYFKRRYWALKEVNYYEGVSMGDEEKLQELECLRGLGYRVRALKRKAFKEPARFGTFECQECHHKNLVKIAEEEERYKSNVDVYLTVDLLEKVVSLSEPIHIVLMAGDGDYVEPIEAFLRLAPAGSKVTILATPARKDPHDNALSVRLRQLKKKYGRDQYEIESVEKIKPLIARKSHRH